MEATGRILYLSRAIERITGFLPEQFYADVGLFDTILLPQYAAAFAAARAQVASGTVRQLDLGLRSRSGGQVILQLTFYQVASPPTGPLFFEGIARDQTSV